jgi:hypothetical protein
MIFLVPTNWKNQHFSKKKSQGTTIWVLELNVLKSRQHNFHHAAGMILLIMD